MLRYTLVHFTLVFPAKWKKTKPLGLKRLKPLNERVHQTVAAVGRRGDRFVAQRDVQEEEIKPTSASTKWKWCFLTDGFLPSPAALAESSWSSVDPTPSHLFTPVNMNSVFLYSLDWFRPEGSASVLHFLFIKLTQH